MLLEFINSVLILMQYLIVILCYRKRRLIKQHSPVYSTLEMSWDSTLTTIHRACVNNYTPYSSTYYSLSFKFLGFASPTYYILSFSFLGFAVVMYYAVMLNYINNVLFCIPLFLFASEAFHK